MARAQIDAVELVEEWVFRDLESGGFTDDDQREILDDLDDLEEQLVTWGRPLGKCLKILTDVGDQTVYRRRQGDFRSYLIRHGDTLYCIGVGERDTTYERDLEQIGARADAFDPEEN